MKSRQLVPEWMDDPNLNVAEHRRALNGLRRINVVSRTGVTIGRSIKLACQALHLSSARILDLGCGSGDVAYAVARSMPATGQWSIEGWDISSTAIDYARQLHTHDAALQRLSDWNPGISISFHQQDVFSVVGPPFDIVYCSLFLHHFHDSDAIRMMRRMRELALRYVIIDDLNRSRLGYWMAKIGVRLLSRSPVVHFDGPQSVRAAMTMGEVQTLARAAGLTQIKLTRHWPDRWLLIAECTS